MTEPPLPARPLRLENWEYDPSTGRLIGNFLNADHADPPAPQQFRFVLTHETVSGIAPSDESPTEPPLTLPLPADLPPIDPPVSAG